MTTYYCKKCKKNHQFHSKRGKAHLKFKLKEPLPKRIITELNNKIDRVADLLLSTIELNDLDFVLAFKKRLEK